MCDHSSWQRETDTYNTSIRHSTHLNLPSLTLPALLLLPALSKQQPQIPDYTISSSSISFQPVHFPLASFIAFTPICNYFICSPAFLFMFMACCPGRLQTSPKGICLFSILRGNKHVSTCTNNCNKVLQVKQQKTT